MKNFEIQSFSISLFSKTECQFLIRYDDSLIPVKYKPGVSSDLVILFHPALSGERLYQPWFQPFLPVNAPQLSIADPTLLGSKTLRAGWFLGSYNENLPSKISKLIKKIASQLSCSRCVYVGGSSGGFAALLYAGIDKGSVAIAACPQTDLKNYVNSHVDNLVKERFSESMSLPCEASLVEFLIELGRVRL